jgi:hypothetical protein
MPSEVVLTIATVWAADLALSIGLPAPGPSLCECCQAAPAVLVLDDQHPATSGGAGAVTYAGEFFRWFSEEAVRMWARQAAVSL